MQAWSKTDSTDECISRELHGLSLSNLDAQSDTEEERTPKPSDGSLRATQAMIFGTEHSDRHEPEAAPPHVTPSVAPPARAPLDTSDPLTGTWRSPYGNGPLDFLENINLRFRNPKTLEMDDYMLNLTNTDEIYRAAVQLELILSELQNLAVVTPLVCMLMEEENRELRAKLHKTIDMVSQVANKYPGPACGSSSMAKVKERLDAISELMYTNEDLSSDVQSDSVRLASKLKGYYGTLQVVVHDYVRKSFDREAYPEWFLKDNSRTEELAIWKAEKPLRIYNAVVKALGDYQSIVQLKNKIDELEQDLKPSFVIGDEAEFASDVDEDGVGEAEA